MQWRLSGQLQAFLLSLMVDGQFVEPDAGSVSVTLRGNDGSILDGIISSAVSGTQVTVITTADQNALADDKLFETRYIHLNYTVNEVPSTARQVYRIHRFIPHTVETDNVRALVGAEFEELPDSAIDVTASYFTLLNSFGEKLPQALARSDAACLAANSAIALQSAIELCPSMPSRLLKSEKADTSAYERSTIDFAKLEADLRGKLADALEQITTAIDGVESTVTLPTFFAVTNQTDRITNTSS
jgi:hypothetical protein